MVPRMLGCAGAYAPAHPNIRTLDSIGFKRILVMFLSRRAFLYQGLLLTAAGVLASCTDKSIQATSTPPPSGPPVVLADGLNFPEGPAFDSQGNLWCTEIGSGTLVKFADGKLERTDTGGKPNSMAFDRLGRIWICDSGQNKIRRLDLSSGKWETLLEEVDGQALQTPNDLSFDARGNLLFSCPNFASEEKTGYVVCLTPAGKAMKIASGYYRPNGLEIVDGGKALVVADTYQKTLFKGSWNDQELLWENPAAWAKVGGSEGPDGMAFGADGLLYQAIYGDGAVRVVGADGKIRREISVPGHNVTNAAVDPSGKLGIVVTETEKGQLLSYPEIQPGEAIFDGGDAWK
jgi:gluconolactonase